ncbi:MAG: hypothetical protein IPJ88_17945 [Myxococcales bacterium]|nr:MAG: hypothetical protein IPJ88_17945 [Myxococcales bacterium]
MRKLIKITSSLFCLILGLACGSGPAYRPAPNYDAQAEEDGQTTALVSEQKADTDEGLAVSPISVGKTVGMPQNCIRRVLRVLQVRRSDIWHYHSVKVKSAELSDCRPHEARPVANAIAKNIRKMLPDVDGGDSLRRISKKWQYDYKVAQSPEEQEALEQRYVLVEHIERRPAVEALALLKRSVMEHQKETTDSDTLAQQPIVIELEEQSIAPNAEKSPGNIDSEAQPVMQPVVIEASED